jgi:hypothetical protein
VLAVADKNFDEYSNQNCYAQIQANIRMPAHDNDKMHTVSSSYCNLNHMRHTISPLHWAFCKSEREILLNEFDIYLVYRTVVVWNQLLSFFAMLTCGWSDSDGRRCCCFISILFIASRCFWHIGRNFGDISGNIFYCCVSAVAIIIDDGIVTEIGAIKISFS